jgi:hypothetical protein
VYSDAVFHRIIWTGVKIDLNHFISNFEIGQMGGLVGGGLSCGR